MTNNEFFTKLNGILSKYPLIAKSNPMSLNELVYVLRMEDEDYCINDNLGGCIPSVKETFIPTRLLAKKIKSVEWDEEVNEISDTNVIFVNYK